MVFPCLLGRFERKTSTVTRTLKLQPAPLREERRFIQTKAYARNAIGSRSIFLGNSSLVYVNIFGAEVRAAVTTHVRCLRSISALRTSAAVIMKQTSSA